MSSQILTEDFIQYKSVINLLIEFLSSREKLKDLKLNKKKILIGSLYPGNSELIYAAGGVPVYPIRMQKFGDQKLIRAIDLGKSLLGDKIFTQLMRTFKEIDKSNTVEKLIQNLYDEVIKAFTHVYNIGIELGISDDSCYGIKLLSGMFSDKGKNLNACLLQSIRCSAFQKTYETCALYSPGIWLDVPPKSTNAAHESAVANVQRVIYQLEKITGHSISNSSLKSTFEITNQCKNYNKKIIQIMLGDTYPLHPKTFGELQALIEISFQDYLSDPPTFLKILKAIYEELVDHLRKPEYQRDVKEIPKILFTPRFGGWDSIVEDYIFENGGRIIYSDWFIYGFMDPISTSGDMISNYASYMQNAMIDFGYDNLNMAKNILHFIDENHINGVIYNQLFGCHSLSTGYFRLRQELLKREIPSTMVSFNQVGENREQLKTRVIALMELLHQ